MDSFSTDLNILLDEEFTDSLMREHEQESLPPQPSENPPSIDTHTLKNILMELDKTICVEDGDEIAIIEDINIDATANHNVLFNGDPLLPIYEKSRSNPCSTKDVVSAILKGIPDSLSAKLVPSQPKDNLCFMIALKYLQAWKDALSDDLGVWTPTGTRTLFSKRLFSDDGTTSIQSSEESHADIKALRYLYCYPSEKDFKRIIITAFSKTEVGWTMESHLHVFFFIRTSGMIKA